MRSLMQFNVPLI